MIDTILLELPSSFKYLTMLGACVSESLRRMGNIREDVSYDIQLAVHEVAVNIIQHAYEMRGDQRIKLVITLDDINPSITVQLIDTGISFNYEGVVAPNLEQANENGYGLYLVKELMDEVTYQPANESALQNTWRLVKHLV